MIPWIQVYSNLPMHPKTARLAEELGLGSGAVCPNTVAVGVLVSLWTWAIQNAYDGDLSRCSPRLIADACRWRRKPETLVEGLRAAGWLDGDWKLHDWEEYAVLLMEAEDSKREKTRERVRRFREKKSGGGDVTVTGNARVTPGKRPVTPPPDQTLPDRTIPDPTGIGDRLWGGGGGAPLTGERGPRPPGEEEWTG